MNKYPEEIVEKVARAITESGIGERGNNVRDWPDDEAAAYRDNGGWSEGNHAALAIRAQKAAIAALDALGLSVWEEWGMGDNGFVDLAYDEPQARELAAADHVHGYPARAVFRRVMLYTHHETPWEVVDR